MQMRTPLHGQILAWLLVAALAAGLWGGLGANLGAAQDARLGDLERDGASFYRFVQPGENTVRVIMLGDVGQTGIYEVGQGIDLSELLALSQAPGFGAQSAERVRNVTVRLHRPEGDQRVVEYEASLDDFIDDPSAYPVLQSGDVVRVEVVERRVLWRDILGIAGSLSSALLLIERAIRLAN